MHPILSLYSRQYLPRKGTETSNEVNSPVFKIVIPDNIYPARGRKQDDAIAVVAPLNGEFPTIFTPQGDGNMDYMQLREE